MTREERTAISGRPDWRWTVGMKTTCGKVVTYAEEKFDTWMKGHWVAFDLSTESLIYATPCGVMWHPDNPQPDDAAIAAWTLTKD